MAQYSLFVLKVPLNTEQTNRILSVVTVHLTSAIRNTHIVTLYGLSCRGNILLLQAYGKVITSGWVKFAIFK